MDGKGRAEAKHHILPKQQQQHNNKIILKTHSKQEGMRVLIGWMDCSRYLKTYCLRISNSYFALVFTVKILNQLSEQDTLKAYNFRKKKQKTCSIINFSTVYWMI